VISKDAIANGGYRLLDASSGAMLDYPFFLAWCAPSSVIIQLHGFAQT